MLHCTLYRRYIHYETQKNVKIEVATYAGGTVTLPWGPTPIPVQNCSVPPLSPLAIIGGRTLECFGNTFERLPGGIGDIGSRGSIVIRDQDSSNGSSRTTSVLSIESEHVPVGVQLAHGVCLGGVVVCARSEGLAVGIESVCVITVKV